jgi:hypothetical protein
MKIWDALKHITKKHGGALAAGVCTWSGSWGRPEKSSKICKKKLCLQWVKSHLILMVHYVLWVGKTYYARLGHDCVSSCRQLIDVLRSEHLAPQGHFAQQHRPCAFTARVIPVCWTATSSSKDVIVALGRMLGKVDSWNIQQLHTGNFVLILFPNI